MKKKYLLIFLFFYFIKPVQAQLELSALSEVSIITAGPGKELFEAFGHSAIRIKDPVLQLDLIYNYGMFDFNQPNFLLNFAKGNMIYSLARYDFKYFLSNSINDKRWVKQQALNLTQPERQAFFMYLENNALPQNTSYLYDPFFDNCATKLRDITKIILGDKVVFNDAHLEKKQTLRSLMNKEISWNTWGNFGINLIAGTILDKKATSSEYMYLPDYVFSAFKNASLYKNNKKEKLIHKEVVLLDYKEIKQKIGIFNPFLIFSIFTMIGIFITYKDYKNKRITKLLDFLIFLITGIIGIVIVFLWFFSTHTTAPNNFNILWAFAPNLIIAFMLLKSQKNKWIQKYIKVLILFLLIIPIIWISGIQSFPITIIPLLLLFLIRYIYLSKALLTSRI